MSAVPGVEEVFSSSSEGSSSVRIMFAWGTNLDAAADDVRERLDRIIGRLPEEVDRPDAPQVRPGPAADPAVRGPQQPRPRPGPAHHRRADRLPARAGGRGRLGRRLRRPSAGDPGQPRPPQAQGPGPAPQRHHQQDPPGERRHAGRDHRARQLRDPDPHPRRLHRPGPAPGDGRRHPGRRAHPAQGDRQRRRHLPARHPRRPHQRPGGDAPGRLQAVGREHRQRRRARAEGDRRDPAGHPPDRAHPHLEQRRVHPARHQQRRLVGRLGLRSGHPGPARLPGQHPQHSGRGHLDPHLPHRDDRPDLLRRLHPEHDDPGRPGPRHRPAHRQLHRRPGEHLPHGGGRRPAAQGLDRRRRTRWPRPSRSGPSRPASSSCR